LIVCASSIHKFTVSGNAKGRNIKCGGIKDGRKAGKANAT